jgi:hypothetical protein
MQGGDVVWRHGGIDGWSDKVNTSILPEYGSEEDGAGTYQACGMVCFQGFLDRFVFLTCSSVFWRAL